METLNSLNLEQVTLKGGEGMFQQALTLERKKQALDNISRDISKDLQQGNRSTVERSVKLGRGLKRGKEKNSFSNENNGIWASKKNILMKA